MSIAVPGPTRDWTKVKTAVWREANRDRGKLGQIAERYWALSQASAKQHRPCGLRFNTDPPAVPCASRPARAENVAG